MGAGRAFISPWHLILCIPFLSMYWVEQWRLKISQVIFATGIIVCWSDPPVQGSEALYIFSWKVCVDNECLK